MNLHYRTGNGDDKKFSGKDEKEFKKARPSSKGKVSSKAHTTALHKKGK